ncbi:XdhC family protein [Streptomyces rishiriensis]|uniref:XdhC family protein n=1 Tax=Streptomyces rishiriensis TaxID=68264 RepID=UPI0037D96B28
MGGRRGEGGRRGTSPAVQPLQARVAQADRRASAARCGRCEVSPQPQAAVGAPMSRVDGRLKVTGQALYAAEHDVEGVHDAKFDIPLLRLALDLPVGYVGAMGSRRTHDERLHRLREAGVPEARLARLRSPIGLDLGARTPEETAVSITAEIIFHANHATGLPLSDGTGPIHGPLVRRRADGRSAPHPAARVGMDR